MRRKLLARCALIICLASAGWILSQAAAARHILAAKYKSPDAALVSSHPGDAQAEKLRCSPRRLYRGETLTLFMSESHGGYLAVINPRGAYRFLTSDQPETVASEREAGVYPLINPTEFGRMRELKLSTSDTKALDYNKKGGRRGRVAEAVFRQTGWYKVLLSDTSFEREDPSFDGMCRVYYVNRKHP